MTTAQSDALIDLYEQCVVVTAAHAQKEASRGAVEEMRRWMKATAVLSQIYSAAYEMGVPEQKLMEIIGHNLPEGVTISIEREVDDS